MMGISRKIDRLIEAMVHFEGWKPADPATGFAGSRSWRNHNPGNLRSSPFEAGKIDGFSFFRSDEIGLLALHWDIIQKAKGNTVTKLTGQSTIRDLIFVYAPPSDNNHSEAYLKSVVAESGLPETTKLSELITH